MHYVLSTCVVARKLSGIGLKLALHLPYGLDTGVQRPYCFGGEVSYRAILDIAADCGAARRCGMRVRTPLTSRFPACGKRKCGKRQGGLRNARTPPLDRKSTRL